MEEDKKHDQDLSISNSKGNNSKLNNRMTCLILEATEIRVIKHKHLISMHIQIISHTDLLVHQEMQIFLILEEVALHQIKQSLNNQIVVK